MRVGVKAGEGLRMKRILNICNGKRLAVGLACACTALFLAGCDRDRDTPQGAAEDAGERIGETLDESADKLRDAGRDAERTLEKQREAAEDAARDAGRAVENAGEELQRKARQTNQ